MLRITIEVCPGGNESRKFEVAKAEIGNISNLADTSDYLVRMRENYNRVADTEGWTSEGRIESHPRRSSVWSLIAKVATMAAQEAERRSAACRGDASSRGQ